MPIKTLQPRLAEIGRLRMGRQVPTRNGKTRPERLAEWRLTSAQQGLLEYARDKYGGTITPWDGAPTEHVQYELFTDSPALDVLIPPGQIVSQWMETWSGGGCQRRCDGIHEYLSDQPCLCQHESPLPQEYRCKPTTRLNVILRDVPAVGVWRLEIHGYYGAVELAGMAQLLEDAGLSGRVVPAELRIEQRTIKRPGQPPKHFAVPVLAPESAFVELVVAEQRAALEMRRHTHELEAPDYDADTGEVYDTVEELSPEPEPVPIPAGSGAATSETRETHGTAVRMRAAQADATATRQRHDPAPSGVPTLEQIQALKNPGMARALWHHADTMFQRGVRAIAAPDNYVGADKAWDEFYKRAALEQWQVVLAKALQTSAAGTATPPRAPAADHPAPGAAAAGGTGGQMSDPGSALQGEGGSGPGPDDPVGGDAVAGD
ncbi:MAG TPA: hypothetical protein VF933_16680 [Streptosporangiaceae bacterium]